MYMAVGQKDANPWGPQVGVGSIFPLTNRVFWTPFFLTHSHIIGLKP